MRERIGTGVVLLGLLCAACGGVDEREAEALIDEIEAIYAESIETMEENAALAIERAGKPLPGRGNPGEEILARRARETEEEWEEELEARRQQKAESMVNFRDALERDAWDEVFGEAWEGMFGEEIPPLDLLRESKRYAEMELERRQARLEREASGETARSISGMWNASVPGLAPAEPK